LRAVPSDDNLRDLWPALALETHSIPSPSVGDAGEIAAEMPVKHRRSWHKGKARPLSIVANRPELDVRR